MTILDDLDLMDAATPATNNGGSTRKCRRHDWFTHPGPTPCYGEDGEIYLPVGTVHCRRCFKAKDPSAARRGRTNRQRGNAIERRVAAKVGGARTGQFGGKNDVTSDLFLFQVKSRKGSAYPRWMSDELDALRVSAGAREGVLVVVEAFSDRKPARALYVVDERTWLALHGGKA